MAKDTELKRFYDALVSDGYNLPEYAEFEAHQTAPGQEGVNNRLDFYKFLKEDDPDGEWLPDYQTYASRLFAPKPKSGQQTANSGQRTADSGQQPVKVEQPKGGWQPSAEKLAEFDGLKRGIDSQVQGWESDLQGLKEKIANREEYERTRGLSGKLGVDPLSGEAKMTYATKGGNRSDNRTIGVDVQGQLKDETDRFYSVMGSDESYSQMLSDEVRRAMDAELAKVKESDAYRRALNGVIPDYGIVDNATNALTHVNAAEREEKALADAMSYHNWDLDKMTDDVMSRIPVDTWGKLMEQSGGKADEMKAGLRNDIRASLEKDLIGRLAPKGDGEAFMRGAGDANLVVGAWRAIKRGMGATSADYQRAYDAATAEYLKDKPALKYGSMGLGMMADPTMLLTGYAGGLAGNIVARGAMNLAAKSGARAIGVFGRAGMETLATRGLKSVASGALNLGLYEGIGDAVSQAKLGGAYNAKTGKYEYDWMSPLESAGHGAMMGAGLGVIGSATGEMMTQAGKIGNKTGRVAARMGTQVAGTVGEVALFAMPNVGQQDENGNTIGWGDALAESAAMLGGIKFWGAVRGALGGHKNANGESVSLREHLKEKYAGDGKSRLGKLKSDMRDLGYGDISDWLDYEMREDVGRASKGMRTVGGATRNAELANRGVEWREGIDGQEALSLSPEGAKRVQMSLESLMADPNVPETLKADFVYFVSGERLAVSNAEGVRTVNRDGKHYVEYTASDGKLVDREECEDAEAAKGRVNDFIGAQMTMQLKQAEVVRSAAVEAAAYGTAVEQVAAQEEARARAEGDAGLTMSGKTVDKIYEGAKGKAKKDWSDLESRVVEGVDKAVEDIRGMYSAESVESVRSEVGEMYGMDMDNVLSKPYGERSETERQAVEDYMDRLKLVEDDEGANSEQRIADSGQGEYQQVRKVRLQSHEEDKEGEVVELENGYLSLDKDGKVRREGSDKTVVVRGADGEPRMVGVEEIEGVVNSEQRTANSEQGAVESEQLTANSEQRTADSGQGGEERGVISFVGDDGEEKSGYLTGVRVTEDNYAELGLDAWDIGKREMYDPREDKMEYVDDDFLNERVTSFESDDKGVNSEQRTANSEQGTVESGQRTASSEQGDAAPLEYKVGDKLLLRDENGEAVEAEVVYAADEDGMIEVSMDGGDRTMILTAEELDGMVEREQRTAESGQGTADRRIVINGREFTVVKDESGNQYVVDENGSMWGHDGNGENMKPYRPGENVSEWKDEQIDRMFESEKAEEAAESTENAVLSEGKGDNSAVTVGNGQGTAGSERTAEELTPLQKVPRDAKGEPVFESVEPETAWDALVEYSDQDAVTAKEIADAMVEEKRKAFEKAQKLQVKGKTPSEMLASKRANAAELEKAQREYEHWRGMADVERTREERAANESEEVTDEPSEAPQGEAEISAPLSETESDEFGKPLVLAKDGTTIFGEITEESGLAAAPIRLSLGENKVDEKGKNHGYGLLHIEAGHGEQIRNAGYGSVESFVEAVAKNYTDIREGSIIADNQTYLLEVSDEHNNTLFIQLSRDGSYWNVNSAGIFKKKYSRRKPKVYSVPTIGESKSTDTFGVDSGHTKGATAPAGNSPQTSGGKVKEFATEKQVEWEKSSEGGANSEQLTGGSGQGDVRSKVGDGGLVNRPEGLSDGAAAVLESVGRQLGLRVRFAGAEELGGADGMYDPRSREVVLSRDLVGRGDDAVREGMMGVVAGHEVGHHLRVVSRENAVLWNAYRETVRELMGADAFEAEVDRVLDLYKRKFAEMRASDPERWGGLRDIDRDVAEEEVLVERGGRVMADSPEAMRRLIDRVAESGESAKGVVERMVAYLDELLAKLREGLGLSGRDAEAVEARLRAVREAWSGLYEYAAAKEREAVDAGARFRVVGDEMVEVSERERRVSKAVTGLLEDAGIEVVADAAEMRRALGEGDAQMQARVSQLGKAASIIRSWIGNNMRDKKIEIELPKVVVSLIRRRLGRDFDSHTITANSVAHALKNHGIDGKKLTSNSIPLREDDLELIPYIMSAPDRVERGNPEGGRVSIKFVKELSNGYVVVVEKEYKNSPDDMETITMWADQSSNALNAAKGAPKHNVHNAIISTDDAAKIRKDAENAIAREINSEKMTEFLRTSRGDVYGFVKGGKVYIDPELLNPNTPIHKYTHLWDKALEKANRKLWERGKELMRGLPLWDEVKNDPAYADIAGDEDLLASEVHSRLSGKEGAKLLDDMVERAKSKGAMATAEAVTLKERVKAWLREALGWVRDAFTGKWGADDLSSLTVDEFGAMPVRDLCRGVNPNDVLRKAQQAERVMERNPMLDDYHYGIRGIGDVKTFEEALEGAEREYAEWGELAYPDLDIEGLRRAKETGEITVYSSKPIEDGGFVSTSRRAAKDYAGSGRVYEKKVKLTEVAWLDHEQGQMASDVDSAGDSGVRFRVVGDEPRRVVEERRGEDGGREFAVKRDPQWSAEGDAELVRRLEEGKKRKAFEKALEADERDEHMTEEDAGEGNRVPSEMAMPVERQKYIAGVSRQFDEELQRQIDGTLPQDHIYRLGTPGAILLSTGIPNLSIELSAQRLIDKATKFDHDFNLAEVKGLVDALQRPVAVFAYGDKNKSQNIIVEISHNGKNFVVGMSLAPTVKGQRLEINSIRNVFPKDNAEWVKWIQDGKLLYVDKNQIQPIIDQLQTNPADVTKIRLDLNTVAKLIKDFENPAVSGTENVKGSSSGGGVGNNDIRFSLMSKGEIRDDAINDAYKEWGGREVSVDDYHVLTRADWKDVSEYNGKTISETAGSVRRQWQKMKDSGDYEFYHSPSGSEYLVDRGTGDVYRYADHWGNVASCDWTLDGKLAGRQYRSGYAWYEIPAIGKCNVGDMERNMKPGVVSTYVDKRLRAEEREGRGMFSAEAKRAKAEGMSGRLNVPVRVVGDMSEVEGLDAVKMADGRRRELMLKSRGWYDRERGEVVVVEGNNGDAGDVAEFVLREVVSHRGLRDVLGDEGMRGLMRGVYEGVSEDVRRRIAEMASRYGYDFDSATEGYLRGLSEKGFDGFDGSDSEAWELFGKKALESVKGALGDGTLPRWVTLGDNELRYMLWRDAAGSDGSYVDMARDAAKRRELGVGVRGGLEEYVLEPLGDDSEQGVRFRVSGEDDGTPEKSAAVKRYERESMESDRQAEWLGKVKDALEKDGVGGDLYISRSVTPWGISTYLQSRDLDGLKVRLSDHGVTSNYRVLNEIHVNRDESVEDVVARVKERAEEIERLRAVREAAWERSKAHAREVAEKWDDIKDRFEGMKFSTLERSYWDLDEFMKRHPGAEHVMQTELESRDWNKDGSKARAYRYEWAHKADAWGKPKPSADYIEAIWDGPGQLRFRVSGETDDIWRDGSLGMRERMTAAALRLAASQGADKGLRGDAVSTVVSNLQSLMREMRNRSGRARGFKGADAKVESGVESAARVQRRYDEATVKRVTDLARVLMQCGYMDGMGRGEAERLLTAVRNAVGHQDVAESVETIMDIMVTSGLRRAENDLSKLLSIRGSKVDARGVNVQGKLDVGGQALMAELKGCMDMSPDEINRGLADAMDDMGSDDPVVSENAALRYEALTLAKEYVTEIKGSKADEKALRSEIRTAEERRKNGLISKEGCASEVEGLRDALMHNRAGRIEAYNSFSRRLAGRLGESVEEAKRRREAEAKRVNDIHHMANSDMEGRKANEHRKSGMREGVADRALNGLSGTLLLPLSTFEQMLKSIAGGHAADGEGYLYNHFVRGLNNARAKEIRGYRGKRAVLDAKARELFKGRRYWGVGKVDGWLGAMRYAKSLEPMEVSFMDGGEMRPHELHQGNLLYIYMVDKMADGRMKLRKMGIGEEVVDAISEHLDPSLRELGDWMQDEFLVGTRKEYNETHKRVYGAPMAAIEDYFPLRINGGSRHVGEDIDAVDGGKAQQGAGVTLTGAIKRRVTNSTALDLVNSDALRVVLDHVAEMEHWNAFTELGQDVNTLLSYGKFKQKVKGMHTAYGTGDELWSRFRDCSRMAFGTYNPDVPRFDRLMTALGRNVTASCVSMRLNTALKQLLSMPAVIPDLSAKGVWGYVKNPYDAFRWCMDELPVFEERWKSRISGDPRLMKDGGGWDSWRGNVVQLAARLGMTPNAFVDAMTCSIVAKCIYEKKYSEYVKDGYSKDAAKARAKEDASIGYNLSQQSNEGAYLSPMQASKTWLGTVFTIFRNSPMSYTRQVYDSVRGLSRNLTPGERGEKIEYMQKQILRDWGKEIDTATAEDLRKSESAAERRYNRALKRDMLRFATYGFILPGLWSLGGVWLYQLFGSDEELKDEELKDMEARLLTAPLEGLAGGDVISNLAAGLMTGNMSERTLTKDMPLTQTLSGIAKTIAKDGLTDEFVAGMLSLGMQIGVGVDPLTLANMYEGIVELCGDDPQLANEGILAWSKILNAPQSQARELYYDEIGMKGSEASKLTPMQLAERYAVEEAKKGRVPVSWFKGPDAAVVAEGKEKSLKKIKEREPLRMASAEWRKYDEKFKGMDEEWKSIGKVKDVDYVEYAKGVAVFQGYGLYDMYKLWMRSEGNVDSMVKRWLRSGDAAEAGMWRERIDRYRDEMVKLAREGDVVDVRPTDAMYEIERELKIAENEEKRERAEVNRAEGARL